MPTDKPAAESKPTPVSPYRAPKGVEKVLSVAGGRVRAAADWLLIREHGVPAAEVFFTSYQRERRDPARPITFLFNGGPGAASAFLHMGTAGPMRVSFGTGGKSLPPPVRIVQNRESWLAFTDLVFVDPVGTGLSRTVHESRLEQQGLEVEDEKREKRTKDLPDVNKGFFKIKRDIDVLSEFVCAFLSREGRWDSPVSIAGESYGGFRVGKLMRSLPDRGVGLSSAVMISPAVDFMAIAGSDYDLLSWINSVPTMALAAKMHGKSRGRFASLKKDDVRTAAEDFAVSELAPLLLLGDRVGDATRGRTLKTLADLIGLPLHIVEQAGGRVRIEVFARELLRDEGLICGLYDAAVTGPNVFPDREGWPNPDPTLSGITAAFTASINTLLRRTLGLSTSREYRMIHEEVWKGWSDDRGTEYWQRQLECADDMRYGLALNPSLKLFIAHGWYDLVTTYFSSEQSVAALRLPKGLRAGVRLANYDGGHMFYTWENSRKALLKDVANVVG